jgi:hypothetical protein
MRRIVVWVPKQLELLKACDTYTETVGDSGRGYIIFPITDSDNRTRLSQTFILQKSLSLCSFLLLQGGIDFLLINKLSL